MYKIVCFFFCLLSVGLAAQNNICDGLKMNQLQVVGSHNSYKKLPDKGVFRSLKFFNWIKPSLGVGGIDYGHLPLEQQFDSFAVRSIELDIYNDPKGGNFYKRYGNRLAWKSAKSREDKLKQPGMKMLHIPDIDYNTNYLTFKDALVSLRNWSLAHPTHLPIFVLIETKGESVGDHTKAAKFTQTVPWDAAACDSIDAEIDDVFGKNAQQVLTPDELRGSYATLDEMAVNGGWPLLDSTRGRIIFIMEGGAADLYIQGQHAGLKGRNMFVYSQPGQPECAFVILNDSERSSTKITEAVLKGYMVRTRADSGTQEARTNNYTPWKAALNSGAQIISTDYYRPDPRHTTSKKWSDYHVKLPVTGIGRVSPVLDLPCKGNAVGE